MFDIGFSEILMFGAIALMVLGPEKLPQAARSAGKWYAKIRFTIANVQHEIEQELDIAETRRIMQEELAEVRLAEANMQKELAELRSSMQTLKQHTSPITSSSIDTPSINTSDDIHTSEKADDSVHNIQNFKEPHYNQVNTHNKNTPSLPTPSLASPSSPSPTHVTTKIRHDTANKDDKQ